MINQALLDPQSIVVVGGSNNLHKPGGKVLKNIIDGAYTGELSVVNPKQSTVQGLTCLASLDELESLPAAADAQESYRLLVLSIDDGRPSAQEVRLAAHRRVTDVGRAAQSERRFHRFRRGGDFFARYVPDRIAVAAGVGAHLAA